MNNISPNPNMKSMTPKKNAVAICSPLFPFIPKNVSGNIGKATTNEIGNTGYALSLPNIENNLEDHFKNCAKNVTLLETDSFATLPFPSISLTIIS